MRILGSIFAAVASFVMIGQAVATQALVDGEDVTACKLPRATRSGEALSYLTSNDNGSINPVQYQLNPIAALTNVRIKVVIPPGVSSVGARGRSAFWDSVVTATSVDPVAPPQTSWGQYGAFIPALYQGDTNHQSGRYAYAWFLNFGTSPVYITTFALGFVVSDMDEYNRWWDAERASGCTTTGGVVLTPSAYTVGSGASVTIRASTGVASCTATQGTLSLIASGSVEFAAHAPTVTTPSTMTVTCTGVGGGTGAVTLTVSPAPVAESDIAKLRVVLPASTSGNTIAAVITPVKAAEKGQPVTFWLGGEVAPFGWNASRVLYIKTRSSGWIQHGDAAGGGLGLNSQNAYLNYGAFAETGITTDLITVADGLTLDALRQLKAKLFLAYQLGDSAPAFRTYPEPIVDCSSGLQCSVPVAYQQ